MNKQLSFEELLDRMQHIDPNGEWTGSEYSKDVLEALVSTTLYWLQEQHDDKYLEYLFEQASRLYGAYNDNKKGLCAAFRDFKQAWLDLSTALDSATLDDYVEAYPFNESFDDLLQNVLDWSNTTINKLSE